MTVAEFRALYPQFSTVDDAVIQGYLDLFECIYGHLDLSCQELFLQGLFSAHMCEYLALGKANDPTGGILTSKSVGDVSIGTGAYLAFQGRNPSHFNYTRFGQLFNDTISLFGAGGMMAEPYYG